MKVRYIRESMTGSNSNSGCHWCEIQAINYEGVNVALNKTVTCEGGTSEKGTLDMIVNGNTTVDDYIYFRNDAQNTISVTVDLENVEELDNIKVWHYHSGGRTYKNILLEVSLDGIKWVEIFDSNKNGEYVEVEEGKTHKLEDDRLPTITDSSNLKEITNFYEKYVEQDIKNKNSLVSILNNKNINVTNSNTMVNLINKVGDIATPTKLIASDTILVNLMGINHTSRTETLSDVIQFKLGFEGEIRVLVTFKTSSTEKQGNLRIDLIRNGQIISSSPIFITDYNVLSCSYDFSNIKTGDCINIKATSTRFHETVITGIKLMGDEV